MVKYLYSVTRCIIKTKVDTRMQKIGSFTPTPLKSELVVDRLVTLHYFHYSKEFIFNGERHDFWEMAYVDQGEVGVLAENHGFDLQQGEAIFHKPNEYHSIWAKQKFASVMILSFVCESPAISFFENHIIKVGAECQDILAEILKLGRTCFKDPLDEVYQIRLNLAEYLPFGSLQVLKNYIELLLILMIQGNSEFSRQSRVSLNTKKQGESRLVEAVRQKLRENIHASLKLGDIVSGTYFSKSYLTRLFRERTGQSIMDCYWELKIAEAKRLISGRTLSFSEIAETLGFTTVNYFSAFFKKKAGMTPTEYKNTVRSRGVL